MTKFVGRDVTVIHGDCRVKQVRHQASIYSRTTFKKIGADYFANKIAEELGFKVEKYLANWNEFGKRAAYIRNKAMVDSSPDFVLAYQRNNSNGTAMTMTLAREKGIKVYGRFILNA